MCFMLCVSKYAFSSLLKNGHNINEKDELGFAPLHLAVLLRRNDILTAMIRLKNEGQMVCSFNVNLNALL